MQGLFFIPLSKGDEDVKATLIGAGHTGLSGAVYLSQKGLDITVYTRNKVKASILNGQRLLVSGIIDGYIKLNTTTDLKKAVTGSDLIIIDTWANDHKAVFESIKGLLTHNQSILILNSNWGAFEAYQVLKTEIKEKGLIVAETASQPFLGFYDGNLNLKIKAVKEQVTIATLKEADTEALKRMLLPYFKEIKTSKSIIATSLSSANPIIHLPVAIFNLDRIGQKDDFLFLKNMSPEVVRYIEKADAERVKVGRVLGLNVQPILCELNSFWTEKYPDLLTLFHNNTSYAGVKGPKELTHRFLAEDLPYGLEPVVTLAEMLNIKVPYTKAIVATARLALEDILGNEKVVFSKNEVKEVLENA